jgi:hypothetical protein
MYMFPEASKSIPKGELRGEASTLPEPPSLGSNEPIRIDVAGCPAHRLVHKQATINTTEKLLKCSSMHILTPFRFLPLIANCPANSLVLENSKDTLDVE